MISLGVLGLIAAFTIPKILQGQENQKLNAVGKETAAAITEAYQIVKMRGGVDGGTSVSDLAAQLNYVKIKTSGLIDDTPGDNSLDCSGITCYQLHNGAVLADLGTSFGGTGALNAMVFHIDPDGVYSGSPTGTGKAGAFFLYYNGRLTTIDHIESNTYIGGWGITVNPDPSERPDWLTW